jgi:curli biogenesis system outer membrane secretion channel CsgG
MKNAIILCLLFLTTTASNAQTFDSELEKMAKNISTRLNALPQMQVAVYPFLDDKKSKSSDLGNHVTDEFCSYLTNQAQRYQVMDRGSMDNYMAEHNLNSEGLINPTTAKQFGMLIAADAYVTGTVFVFSATVLRLKVKLVDTETGQILAAASGKLPIDYDMAQYLGITNWKQGKKEAALNKSTNPNCDVQNVGDYCFENKGRETCTVKIHDINNNSPLSTIYREITVQPGQTNCFRDLPLKNFGATIFPVKGIVYSGETQTTSFYVEECGVGMYVIN